MRALHAFLLLAGIALSPAAAGAEGICEAVGTARCFYIDPSSGNDANNGGFSTPWKTFANIQSYYYASWRPPGWVNIKPGDYIYLRQGVHNTVRTPGSDAGPTGGTRAIAYFRDWPTNPQSGTAAAPIHLKSYPGERAVIGDIASEPYTHGIHLHLNQWWEISDLELRDIPGTCLDVAGGGNHRFWNLEVHDCGRKDTDGNPAGIKLSGVTKTEIFNSRFYDTFSDPRLAPPATGGTWFLRGAGIQLFQGSDHTIHHNVFTNTKQGKDINGNDAGYANGMFQKHAQSTTTGYLHVHSNKFSSCGMAFGSGTQNTWFHHNIITDSKDPIRVADFGGITYQVNQLYEYNTIYGSRAFSMGPSTTPYNNLFPVLPKDIVFRSNIIVDNAASYTGERNMIDIGAYISDTLFDAAAAALSFASNCYFNPNTAPRFAFGAANNGGTYGVKGGVYSLAQWQSLSNNGAALGFDKASIIADPQFTNPAARDFTLLPVSPCILMGAHANAAPKPSAPKGLQAR